MRLTIDQGEHIGDAVDVGQQAPTERHRLGVAHDGGTLGRLILRQSKPEQPVDDVAQPAILLRLQTLELSRDIVVQRNGRPHASQHSMDDVVMRDAPRTRLGIDQGGHALNDP